MTKKQIELTAEDISAVEKPRERARLVKAPEHFISQDLIADINTNGLDEKRRGSHILRSGVYHRGRRHRESGAQHGAVEESELCFHRRRCNPLIHAGESDAGSVGPERA